TSTDVSALHLDFDPISGSSDDTFSALLIESIGATSANEYAINIGSTWDAAIKFQGASDLDIIDNTASAITISEGTNNYLQIQTDNADALLTLDLPVAGSNSSTFNLATANIDKVINLGTGTGIDTINIGTGATGADIITLGNTGVATTLALNSGDTDDALMATLNSVTTGTAFQLNTTGLTTGNAFEILGPSATNILTVGRDNEGFLDFARVSIGGAQTRDQFYVYGRRNSSWQETYQDFVGGSANTTADAGMGDVTLDEDAECRWAVFSLTGFSAIQAIAGDVGPAAGEGCNTSSGGVVGIRRNENPVFETSIMNQNTTIHYIRAGFTNGALGADTVSEVANGIYFRKNTATSNWFTVARTASVETNSTSDTGIAVSVTTPQTLRIEVENLATPQAKFFINGSLVRTETTNLPTVNMGWAVTNGTGAAIAKTLVIDWIKVWHDEAPGGGGQTQTVQDTNFSELSLTEGADLAEYYRGDYTKLNNGTLVRLKDNDGTAKTLATVEETTQEYDSKVIGVVSETPKITLGNPDSNGSVEVALAGRVNIKVTTNGGKNPIKTGDPLAPSSIPGVAMKAEGPGWIVGTAMQDYTDPDPNTIGKIMLFVNRSWYNPLVLTPQGNLSDTTYTKEVIDNKIKAIDATIGLNTSAQELAILQNSATSINSEIEDTKKRISVLEERLSGIEASVSANLSGNNQNITSQPTDPSAFATVTSVTDLSQQIDTLTNTLDLLINQTSSPATQTTQASQSATLTSAVDNLEVIQTLKSLGNFRAIGPSFLADTNIAGSLTVGLLTISDTDTSINALTEPLKIQSNSITDIEIFNGSIKLSSSGTVLADKIETKNIVTEKVAIKGSSTLGTALIKAGDTFVEIETSAITPNSKIFVTPTTETDKTLFIKSREEGIKFGVGIKSSSNEDLKFDWWIIAND
ncbi:MAG: hypothetical protein AAB443_02570, partial [Patescibacteria group bacterium]